MKTRAEIARRYAAVRERAAADGLDAVVVSGSEYSGFEGAVRYLSGFRILHRYAYVVLPVEGSPRSCSRGRRAGWATTRSRGSRTRSSPSIPASGSASVRRTGSASGCTASTT